LVWEPEVELCVFVPSSPDYVVQMAGRMAFGNLVAGAEAVTPNATILLPVTESLHLPSQYTLAYIV
jgi:hypothetical protein